MPPPYYSLRVDIFAITVVLVGVPPEARTWEQVVYLCGDPRKQVRGQGEGREKASAGRVCW